MKKIIWINGTIAGVVVGAVLACSTIIYINTHKYPGSMLLGYASMLVAFSMIFAGVKTYRDQYNGGFISFGKAFIMGLWITLIASSIYVIVWIICYYFFMPDFMEKLVGQMLDEAKKSGATDAAIANKKSEMATYQEMYRNPLFVILLTYAEIVPVGLIVSAISGLILKKNKTSVIS